MTRTNFRLLLALTLSLLLHIAPFIRDFVPQPKKQPPPTLQASLKPAHPAPPPVPLTLEKPTPAAKAEPSQKPVTTNSSKTPAETKKWLDNVKQQLKKQHERGEFYPAEAIAQGLEGEVLVLMLLDSDGQVAASRVEQGSGYKILDNAALQAVRALRSVPADAPRETLLPVRFRLR